MPTRIRSCRRCGIALFLAVALGLPAYVRAAVPAKVLGLSVVAASPMKGLEAAALLRDIAGNVDLVVSASRPLLLGHRKPDDATPSRVVLRQINNGAKRLPVWPQDVGGGPGRRIAAMYISGPRGRSPMEDFIWQQTRFAPALTIMRDQNRPVLVWARRLSTQTGRLYHAIQAYNEWPANFAPTVIGRADHWPGYCLKMLNKAVEDKDLAATRHWSGELASATFALTDLHDWLEFLLRNQLTSLAFQARCRDLFSQSQKHYEGGKYRAIFHADRFPGAYLGLASVSNYLEVERQAELLLRVPDEYVSASRADKPAVHGAVWMPPDLREAFGQLREKLSKGSQATWAAAAQTPLERSYLANMLYRLSAVRMLDCAGVVLQRFDKIHPQAPVSKLMDVLFYRGGDGFGGFEWADRFDARLMAISGGLAGDDERVLSNARQKTFGVFAGWSNYEGFIITLRESLNTGKMDCVRATDMIGSLYRNAGRAGFYNIRWTCGTEAHTVAAAEVDRSGKNEIVIVDGLDGKPNARDVWSEAYFRDHKWPADFPGAQPQAYAVELNGRGLDSYVWIQGIVIQGSNSGLSVQAGIPYMPDRSKPRITRLTKPIDSGTTVGSIIKLGPGNTSATKVALKKPSP